MKFDPTWRQIALLALLLAAVIIAHNNAPLSAPSITSMSTTILGAIMISFRKEEGS